MINGAECIDKSYPRFFNDLAALGGEHRMSSIYGKHFTASLFGESHGKKIGVVIGGITPGIALDLSEIQTFLDRRKAGSDAWSTKRNEPDVFDIVSGFFNGHTTGTPLCALFDNTDTRSKGLFGAPEPPGSCRLHRPCPLRRLS